MPWRLGGREGGKEKLTDKFHLLVSNSLAKVKWLMENWMGFLKFIGKMLEINFAKKKGPGVGVWAFSLFPTGDWGN